jgi:hypothetical protein
LNKAVFGRGIMPMKNDNYEPLHKFLAEQGGSIATRTPSSGWKTTFQNRFDLEGVDLCLSNPESLRYMKEDRKATTTGIYTQIALPLSETTAIAEELGYKHPTYHKRKKKKVVTVVAQMSTDILALTQQGPAVINCKANEERNKRDLEKFKIEETYWLRNWGLELEFDGSYESGDNYVLHENLLNFRPNFTDPPDPTITGWICRLVRKYSDQTWHGLCLAADMERKEGKRLLQMYFSWPVYFGDIPLNLERPFSYRLPLKDQMI